MEVVKGPDSIREEALTGLMLQYEKDVLGMCCLYLHDLLLAEDATQETFLKAYKGLTEFRGECSEKTWLMRIAINTCKDMRRNAWFRLVDRRMILEQLPVPSTPPSEESTLLTTEVANLPGKYREVVLLYYYQRMKLHEVAQILGVSIPAVSKRLKQARRKLHLALEGGCEDE